MTAPQTEEMIVDKREVELGFLHHLDWFYRNENSEEVQRMIELCDNTNDFEKEWCELEEQEAVWYFLDLFALDLRSMLVALVLQRREEEEEKAKEQIDRINDLRGL